MVRWTTWDARKGPEGTILGRGGQGGRVVPRTDLPAPSGVVEFVTWRLSWSAAVVRVPMKSSGCVVARVLPAVSSLATKDGQISSSGWLLDAQRAQLLRSRGHCSGWCG